MGWQAVLDDIAAAKARTRWRATSSSRSSTATRTREAALWLMTDKPWDDPKVTGKEVKILPQVVRIPPLDTLVHDKAYFDAVDASPLHGGLLDGAARLLRLGQRARRRRRP